ncbi:putative nicotinate-nucleotide adenylyltransferase [Gregarina niphandrodes]|uniref:Nicotinate-nucleotide adenylyltransferase n=1 Tax=Gregarina niphandrodes TaxID=110365 RepID=A0A023B264_GRENI|nr:putative nicotinate-nucleotide adenylyltransferase [Gregarina niphandrodes]EZG51418.1 putative nicotinate-nucleotide adenylyltransferase [Gregarina niphandrodes]|eukprot:XP_011131973.1 putative nicotinate-nucleotide adenylyltransferase [Gregarina niphandrodes]
MEPLVEDIEVDDTEIAKGRYVPTYEMLDLFAEQHPDEECYVVIGEDQCCRMSHWVRGDWMRDNALFLIMPRKGYAPPSGPLPAEHVKKFVRCPVREDCYIEISSTRVRQWLKEGQTGKVDRYVLPSVLQYIQAHNLYT